MTQQSFVFEVIQGCNHDCLHCYNAWKNAVPYPMGQLDTATTLAMLGKMLDQTGYLRELREEQTEEAEGRVENLMELVSAAREYETRDPEPSLGGFVDRLSLLSEADEESGTREARATALR